MTLSAFFRGKAPFFLLYLLLFGLLSASFALYGLPVRAVAYPMALGLLLVAGYLFWDFRREVRHFARLTALEAELDALRQEVQTHQTQARQRLDYYTLWAHQIKTPIAAMHLDLQGEDSPRSRRLAAELNRVEGYADMVLTYLRLDADTTDYVFREVDLDAILRGAVRKFSREFIARRIALEYTPVDTVVLTDEKWLAFVVEQLLSNALKYTPAGSISLYLEDPKTLCIRDTGMGIAPEDLPRIFDQGFTGRNGRADKKASGLGLYLCKRVCDALGHGITAESRPGQGTTLRLDLSRSPLVPN